MAERVLDPGIVVAAAGPGGSATLADGLPGTALLHARLAALDPRFEQAAIEHWERAATEATRSSRSGGTFHVLGGLSASLIIGSPYLGDPDVTRAAVDRAVRWSSAFARSVADQHACFLRFGGRGTPWHVYDVITGLAGLGRVLLAAATGGHTDAESGLQATLDALVTMLTSRAGRRPGWWAAPEQHPPVVAARLGDSGAATTGTAHGVAGPMAMLACALAAGYQVPGQDAAIRQAVDWLGHWRTEVGWPTEVTGEELDAGRPAAQVGRQVAWCYGAPGIGRALHLAGTALGDAAVTNLAQTAFCRLVDRQVRWDAQGPTLCHGHAGVMRCAAGVDDAVADRALHALKADFEPSRPFAFAHHEHGQRQDNPGFLTGAAGIALVLADHAGLPVASVSTPWDALLLMS